VSATIVYLHGFNSAPSSAKARALADAIESMPPATRPEYFVPHLHHRPAVAMRAIASWLDTRDDAALTFVGSSLGGFYATHLAERYGAKAALINPTIRPFDDLKPYLGAQHNPQTGEDYDLTPGHFGELAALAVARPSRPDRYFLLVQAGDEILDWRQAVAFYAGAWQFVQGGGDHAFRDFELRIPAILRFAGVGIA
jgi:predicted esterase YcpF (UPF0227 family)